MTWPTSSSAKPFQNLTELDWPRIEEDHPIDRTRPLIDIHIRHLNIHIVPVINMQMRQTLINRSKHAERVNIQISLIKLRKCSQKLCLLWSLTSNPNLPLHALNMPASYKRAASCCTSLKFCWAPELAVVVLSSCCLVKVWGSVLENYCLFLCGLLLSFVHEVLSEKLVVIGKKNCNDCKCW